MFILYHSNQLDLLKSLLAELLRSYPAADPLATEQILVQSPGMAQWLKLELAKELGIVANYQFPLPATLIWKLFVQLLPNVPERSAFNKEAMQWKLMQILPQQLHRPEFASLENYLRDDVCQRKRYQLSAKIADIFDQYLVYRPDWIYSWEQGRIDALVCGEHPWQPLLWQALYDKTLQQGQSPYHRANLYQDFIASLDRFSCTSDALPKTMPSRLFVFGISALPPRYLDALEALGSHIDVHLMQMNPCRYYWGEVRDRKFVAQLPQIGGNTPQFHDESEPFSPDFISDSSSDPEPLVGNSLLASLGKLGRDQLYLLAERHAHEVEAFVDIERDSLLHSLQSDILNLEDPRQELEAQSSQHKRSIQAIDDSLTVHICHSPMREVEVLQDNLLWMLEEDPLLSPRDIVVMVADINRYSPYIQAVFGDAPTERYIPFSISDQSAQQESPILQAFLTLLELPDMRCTLGEILGLLEVPAILNQFGLDESSFARIKLWLEEAGVRWGLDEQTGKGFDLPPSLQNTWLFGLRRMLLGYALPQDAGMSGDVLAYDEIEGAPAQWVGCLGMFVDALFFYRQHLSQTQTIGDWSARLSQLIEQMFLIDEQSEFAITLLKNTLGQLCEQLDAAGYDEPLSPGILRDYFQERLTQERMSQRFLSGQLNFCTLMPMRSIPFRVVCLLGMNDGAYPRNVIPESFDLMVGRTKAGDRSRREDDRYLFLEAVLSAQSKLYISYVGRSIQDNAPKSPSLLVNELLEYCQMGYCLSGDESESPDVSARQLLQVLTFVYPMTPYSPDAFSGKKCSFASQWLDIAQRKEVIAKPFWSLLPPLAEQLDAVELVDLQRFWRLPVRYFFNRRLNIYFDLSTPTSQDQEPFVLDGLERYLLREQLLQKLLETGSESEMNRCVERFVTEQQARGILPYDAFGQLEIADELQAVRSLALELRPFLVDKLDDLEVDLHLADIPVLQGWIKQRYRAGLLRYRSGKLRTQDLLAAWIDHLVATLCGAGASTYLFGHDECYLLREVEMDFAKLQLGGLMTHFERGLSEPLLYLPRVAGVGLDQCFDSKGNWSIDEASVHKALSRMEECFSGTYRLQGEVSDPYVQRMWPIWNADLGMSALDFARDLLQPVFEHRVFMERPQ